jgi:hypothetical protein
LLVSMMVPVAAEEPEQKPMTPIEKELDTIRGMIHNANMKFRNGIAGVTSSGGDVRVTPAQRCCSGNLEHIKNSMNKLREILRDRTVCFERKRRVEDVEIATVAVRDMRVLDSSIQLFTRSELRQEVDGALASCTRAFLRLTETLSVLPECETQSAAAEAGN